MADGTLELGRRVLHHVERRLGRPEVRPVVLPVVARQERSVTLRATQLESERSGRRRRQQRDEDGQRERDDDVDAAMQHYDQLGFTLKMSGSSFFHLK